jgi:hypothetical protein
MLKKKASSSCLNEAQLNTKCVRIFFKLVDDQVIDDKNNVLTSNSHVITKFSAGLVT